MEFLEIKIEEYTEFTRKHELRNFLQSKEMAEVSKKQNTKDYYVGVKENDKIIAATRLVAWKNKLNQVYFYAPRGPLLDYKNKEVLTFFTKEIKKYIKNKKGYVLHIDPVIIHKERDINGEIIENGIDNTQIINNLKQIGYHHQGFNISYDYSKQIRWVFCLDIENKTEQEIFKNMKQNHRNIINKTEKFAIEIKELTYDELPIYKKITEDTSERRSFQDKPLTYYQKIYKEFVSKNEAKFIVAYLNVEKNISNLQEQLEIENKKYQKSSEINPESGKTKELKITVNSLEKRIKEAKELLKEGKLIPLSAALFIMYEGEITYLFSGSYEKYMNYYAQYAIQWYMIKYGIKNNFKIYNFYGITGNFDKKDPEYGVYEFKKGFGGQVVEYIGDFELPISNYYYLNKIIKKIK